jgi:uncharacterized protein YndB with AHSA1/START domain
MTMTRIRPAPIRQVFEVPADLARAFEVFFTRMHEWSPLDHSLSGGLRAELKVEPFPGGRWVETGENGRHCDWGRVVEWDPPRRALLLWQISGAFAFDPAVETEVEVVFEQVAPKRTRVSFEHRALERLGAAAEAGREAMAGEHGWQGSLRTYVLLLEDAA